MRACWIWIAIAAACGPTHPTPVEPTEPTVPIDAATTVAVPAVDATPVPLPLDRDMPTLATRLAELYGAAGDALAAAGVDCARASTALVAVRDRFEGVRAAIARVEAEGRAEQLEPELDRRRDSISAALARMQPTLDACRTDVRLDEALEGLAGGGGR